MEIFKRRSNDTKVVLDIPHLLAATVTEIQGVLRILLILSSDHNKRATLYISTRFLFNAEIDEISKHK